MRLKTHGSFHLQENSVLSDYLLFGNVFMQLLIEAQIHPFTSISSVKVFSLPDYSVRAPSLLSNLSSASATIAQPFQGSMQTKGAPAFGVQKPI